MKSLAITLCLVLSSISSFSASKGEKIFKNKCMSCHSQNEIFPKVPVLFGQEPGYIINQLNSYKAGDRQDSNMGTMNNVAKRLSQKDIREVAAYVAGIDPCVVKMTIDPKAEGFLEKFKAGRELVKNNNCMHCHGSFHHAAPRLYGQKKAYLDFTLTEFMNGSRKNKYMDRILPILDDENIEYITTFLNGNRLMRECN